MNRLFFSLSLVLILTSCCRTTDPGSLKFQKEIEGVWECTVGTPEAIVPTSVRSFQIKEAECSLKRCPVRVSGSMQKDTAVFCIQVGPEENFYGLAG